MLARASLDDASAILRAFTARRDIFPHIRADYVRRMVAAGTVIYDRGVIIVYHQYRRSGRVGTVLIPAGAVMLHQILNTYTHPSAAKPVIAEFFAEFPLVFLSVRAENARARAFYVSNGMREVGTVVWKNGTLPGVVYQKGELVPNQSAIVPQQEEKKNGETSLFLLIPTV